MAEPLAVLVAPEGSAPEGPAQARAATLFGLQACERTVLALQRAGVREFLLAGEREAAARFAATLRSGRCRRAAVRVLPPGASLRPWLERDAPCFVARADTLYDRRLLVRFVAETARAAGTVAAVDRRPEALEGQAGAPRVAGFAACAAPDEAPAALRVAGRGLAAPEGVLTGLARVGPSFARALEDAPERSRSIANALTLLARRERVDAFAVAELWQWIRTGPGRAEDLVLARRKVLGGAVGVSDGPVARHLNRPLSLRLAERLLSRDVKPWQISVASFLGVAAAGGAFAMGHATTGGVVAQAAAVLDGVDKPVADVRYQDSAFAGVYDALLDRVGEALLIGGMTLYAWLMGAGHSAVALGFAAVAGSQLSMLVKEKYGTQFQQPYRMEREGRWRWLLLGRDGRLFLTLVAGVTGYVEAVLAYLAVGTHLHAGLRIYRIRAEVHAG